MPRHQTKPSYNDNLSAEDQISTEEAIASTIFALEGLSEETCAELGREILMLVLAKFRPDLVEG